MLISYNWLKEYVALKESPEELASLLAMSGINVESLKAHGHDHIIEIEITANRPDWLSMIGVAREVSAITGSALSIPKIKSSPAAGPVKPAIDIKVYDKALCPKYTARIVKNVKVKDSPGWLKAHLESAGLRPINNIVDITNFCLLETGEPMHAFDVDRLKGGVLSVRKAGKGEKIKTIDGLERSLDDSMLVIADSSEVVAIAGVMGGLNSEVTASTSNILLEAAFFDPISVRRTSRKLALSSESSYRFERRVDIDNIGYSSCRAFDLILELSGGEDGGFIDISEKPEQKKPINLRFSKCNGILGLALNKDEITKIASSIGLAAAGSSEDGLKLLAPSFRYDLNDEIDVIEDIARIYNYQKIPETIPNLAGQPKRFEEEMVITGLVRKTLTGLGLDEVLTYSLTSRKMLAAAGSDGTKLAEVKNPLTSEEEVMRPDLFSGMLETVLWNINRKNRDLKLFEIGNIYLKEGALYSERRHLSMAMAGEAHSDWAGGSRQSSFFELKGIVEALFTELGICVYEFNEARDGRFSPSTAAHISVEGEPAGVMGQVCSSVLKEFDIKEKVYYCEICLERVAGRARLKRHFADLPKYPSAFRDISIVAAKDAANGALVTCMKAAGGAILKDARLVDRYSGKQIPDGRVGLTYRLEYRDPARTLEEKDVQDAHTRILRELETKFSAKLR